MPTGKKKLSPFDSSNLYGGKAYIATKFVHINFIVQKSWSYKGKYHLFFSFELQQKSMKVLCVCTCARIHTHTVRTHVRIVHTYVVLVYVRTHNYARAYVHESRTYALACAHYSRAYACLRTRYISVETKIVDRSDILKNRSDISSKNRSVIFIVFWYQKSHFQFNQTY